MDKPWEGTSLAFQRKENLGGVEIFLHMETGGLAVYAWLLCLKIH